MRKKYPVSICKKYKRRKDFELGADLTPDVIFYFLMEKEIKEV